MSRNIAWTACAVAVVAGVVGWLWFDRAGSSPGGRAAPAGHQRDEAGRQAARFREVASLAAGVGQVSGVAVGPDDVVVVCGDGGLAWFDADHAVRKRVDLEQPARCVDVDGKGTVFVGLTNRVAVHDSDGAVVAEWPSLGQESLVTSLAAGSGGVFVADAGQGVVWQFDTEGRLRSCIGQARDEKGEPAFLLPSAHFDVALGVNDSLWITDPGRRRVKRYGADGKVQEAWGTSSMSVTGFCGCCNPTDLAVGADGRFYTSEKGLVRVKMHDAQGRFEGVVAGPPTFQRGLTGLDLAVDARGRVYVVDPARNAVRVFAPDTAEHDRKPAGREDTGGAAR